MKHYINPALASFLSDPTHRPSRIFPFPPVPVSHQYYFGVDHGHGESKSVICTFRVVGTKIHLVSTAIQTASLAFSRFTTLAKYQIYLRATQAKIKRSLRKKRKPLSRKQRLRRYRLHCRRDKVWKTVYCNIYHSHSELEQKLTRVIAEKLMSAAAR